MLLFNHRIKKLSEKLQGSSVLSGLGLSPTHLPHIEEETGKELEARKETDGGELVPEGQQVEVELHVLEQHSKPRATLIIPGSIETDI